MFTRRRSLLTPFKATASELGSSASSLSEPESPTTCIRVIQVDSSTSLVLKDEATGQPSILNQTPPPSDIAQPADVETQESQELKNESMPSLLSLTRPSMGSRSTSEPRIPVHTTAPQPPTPPVQSPQLSTSVPSTSSSRRNSVNSPRVNFAPLPQTRSRSGSASYGINARAAMLQATRDRRSSNPESAQEPFTRRWSGGHGGTMSLLRGHPADGGDDDGFLSEEDPDEALELEDEDRYCLDGDERKRSAKSVKGPLYQVPITENKLWVALQSSRSRRNSSASSSYQSSGGSAGSSYESTSVFG